MVEKHRNGMINSNPREEFKNAYRAWRIRVKARELKRLVRSRGAKIDLEVNLSPEIASKMNAAVRYAVRSFTIARMSQDSIIGRAKRRLFHLRRDREYAQASLNMQKSLEAFEARSPAERERVLEEFRRNDNWRR